MDTRAKIGVVALLALVAMLLVGYTREDPGGHVRSAADRRGAFDPHLHGGDGSMPVLASEGTGGEGASGAEEAAEPPLTPGKGCVRGVVRFEDGEPLAGVGVSLWGASTVYATTDSRGRFHLHDDWVAERALYLTGPDRFAFLLHDVKMVVGESVHVEIVVKRGMRVASRVLSAVTGAPVAGAHIELRRWEGGTLADGGQGVYGGARTDATGRFAFDHVLPADYSLAIIAKGYEAQYARWDLRDVSLPETFRLQPARRLEIHLKNAPPRAIGTTVRWSLSRSGMIVMVDGTPTFLQEPLMINGEAALQEPGVLVGDAPPPGRFEFNLWRTDHLPALLRHGIEFGNAPVETVTLELKPGLKVEGTVRWPDQKPVVGADVWAAGIHAKTDAEGRFVFAWLAGAVAGATLEFKVGLQGAMFPMGEQAIGLREPQVVNLTMPGTGSVRLEVAGVESGRLGAIEIRRPGESDPLLERRLDRPSREPIVLRGVPPGRVLLDIWQWGRGWVQREIEVEQGAPLDLGVVELPAWPRPEIRVRVPAGKHMPGWVSVLPSGDAGVTHSRADRVVLDKEGRGILPSQPPGTRRVIIQVPFGASLEVEFTVDATEPLPVDVLLDPK